MCPIRTNVDSNINIERTIYTCISRRYNLGRNTKVSTRAAEKLCVYVTIFLYKGNLLNSQDQICTNNNTNQ
jgi:hypothetical protein